jgi:hypothetical protein
MCSYGLCPVARPLPKRARRILCHHAQNADGVRGAAPALRQALPYQCSLGHPPELRLARHLRHPLLQNPTGTTFLQDVATRLEKAFNQAGYGEMSWYEVPDGFAMVSRLEQFSSDGTPLEGEDRFASEIAQPRSLGERLRGLFIARQGHYRVITFIVTSVPIQQSNERLSRDRAMELVSTGADRLSEGIRNQVFSGNHRCTALIYEFEQRTPDHAAEFVTPSRLDGTVHLRRSGILTALEGR